MRRDGKWSTMHDVARRAGVGTITVSRALRTPNKVSDKTREKILRAVDEIGYVLDETAGALSSKRSRTVCAIISTLEQSIFSSTIDGLTDGLSPSGMQLFLGTAQYNLETEENLVKALLGRRPDAVILTSSMHTPITRQLLTACSLPVFELWELPEDPIYAAVGFSNYKASFDITKYLQETCRQNIAFIRVDNEHENRGLSRMRGYMGAIAAHQDPRLVELLPRSGAHAADYGAEGLAQILTQWPDTGAIVCANDSIALGVWCEAMRRGISVPSDIALTGFGNFEPAGSSALGITTVHIDGYKMGQITADLINGFYARETQIDTATDIGYKIIKRNSA